MLKAPFNSFVTTLDFENETDSPVFRISIKNKQLNNNISNNSFVELILIFNKNHKCIQLDTVFKSSEQATKIQSRVFDDKSAKTYKYGGVVLSKKSVYFGIKKVTLKSPYSF